MPVADLAAVRRRRRLTTRLHELAARLRGIEFALDQRPPADFADAAAEREGDETLEALGAAGLAEMRAIGEALGRLDAGRYGICMRCGEAIAPARLDAVPHAATCAVCARG